MRDPRASDPDETAGRAIYRAIADKLASSQINIARRHVRLDGKKSAALARATGGQHV